MPNLPDDDWNDFGLESGEELSTTRRTSADSYDSGYASQPCATIKLRKNKASTSPTLDNSDRTLVRCFRVFHATKGNPVLLR
jgi:hypothetical protein